MKVKLETSKEYLKALEDAKRFKPEENKEEITGFTRYSGTGKSDKTYPILFNFIISLLLQIIEKLNTIIKTTESRDKDKISNIDSELDKIINGINKLSIEENKIERKPKPYKHWLPRK